MKIVSIVLAISSQTHIPPLHRIIKLMLFHIVNGVHLSLIALDFNQRRVIHSTCGQLNELISCLTSLVESLKIVHSQSVCVGSLS